ncbi:MAG: diguanylate cyclase [Gammaproteobacteria bacterium]
MIHDILACIPTEPIELNLKLAPAFSAIIMRLLNKEPDRRYQSADGLLNDLVCLSEQLEKSDDCLFELGANDFPVRFTAPSRLIGRDAEIANLKSALERAMHSVQRGLLISGPPGVGKTALITELRPLVALHRGWFISGKFDQFHDATDEGPINQILKALSHLLQIESEQNFDAQRQRLVSVLGTNAALMATLNPQMACILGVEPEIISDNSLLLRARKRRAVLDLLRAVADPKRPVALIIDDLQWADANALDFINGVLTDPDIHGLLLIGAFREAELDSTHPLCAMLTRWRKQSLIPEILCLRNLPPVSLMRFLAEMLRMSPEDVLPLRDVIASHTSGNPFDTVELINALRHERILYPAHRRWQWDTNAIRQYVGASTVMELLTVRIARLPLFTQTVLKSIACLGCDTSLRLLAVASQGSEPEIESGILPALEDGLLVLEQQMVTFRHDRVQEAVYRSLSEKSRLELQLTLARRLAEQSAFASKAAELYLATVKWVKAKSEKRLLIDLFYTTAMKASEALRSDMAECYLLAALALMDDLKIAANDKRRQTLERLWHSTLYHLGRLEETDAVYRTIELHGNAPIDLINVIRIQIISLFHRGRNEDALALGFSVLAKLGIHMGTCPAELDAELNSRFELFCRWLNRIDEGDSRIDVRNSPCCDERIRAAARLIDALMSVAFYSNIRTMIWLVFESIRLWIEYGPCAELICPAAHAAFATIIFKEDYQLGYRAVRHLLDVATERDYTSEIPRGLFLYALSCSVWFEPFSTGVAIAQQAYEGLLQVGDVHSAGYTFIVSIPFLLESNPLLEVCKAEVEKALSFAERTGNSQCLLQFTAYQYVLQTLQFSEEGDPLTQADCDWIALIEASQHDPNATAVVHARLAMFGIIFGEPSLLVKHSEALITILPYTKPHFGSFCVYLYRSLALAERVRQATETEMTAIQSEFETCRAWWVRRATEAPNKFSYLLHWIEAEYEAACGHFHQAAVAFDKVLKNEATLQGWYKPVITERAGLFYLEHDLPHLGLSLIKRARYYYEKWGAVAKVKRLESEYDLHAFGLKTESDAGSVEQSGSRKRYGSVVLGSESIDMLAILSASQMLSSETNLERLEVKVVELLCSLTGATKVLLALLDDESGTWTLRPSPTESNLTQAISVEEAGKAGLIPLSVFKFALRNQQPILVKDALQDDRCVDDPYFKKLKYCSLMVAPILNHGQLCAVILLENSLIRGVFQKSLLDTVTLITGQLAVSLENARLYSTLEDRVIERTEALEKANRRLEELSSTDALTGLANRRRFADVIESEWLRARRACYSLSVGLIDVDKFKLYNDRYGHQQGDTCLSEVARALKCTAREGTDLVARYGGEEFVLVLPDTTINGARVVAERMRATVEALHLLHEGSELGIVTISVGVATVIPDAQIKITDLIESADHALYLAKQRGRNCVEIGQLTI